MNPLLDYYKYRNDFKKMYKNKNFKKSNVECPYCGISSLKGNSLKYHMVTTHKNLEDKYKRADKYLKRNIKNNINDVHYNEAAKMNNNDNKVPQYTTKINDNEISKNNYSTKNDKVINKNLDDMIKKNTTIINSLNSENILDFHEKNYSLFNSNLSKKSNKGDNNKEDHNLKKNIEEEDKNNLSSFYPGKYIFKHELQTDNGKVFEEFVINGNEIISNLNKEETKKRIEERCAKYAIIL